MINDDLTATHDHLRHDPLPALRTMRHAAAGLSVGLLVLGACFATAGIGHGGMRVLNTGLTMTGLSGMAGVTAAVSYAGELTVRYVRDLADGLEEGERLIAGAMAGIAPADDELAPRRSQG